MAPSPGLALVLPWGLLPGWVTADGGDTGTQAGRARVGPSRPAVLVIILEDQPRRLIPQGSWEPLVQAGPRCHPLWGHATPEKRQQNPSTVAPLRSLVRPHGGRAPALQSRGDRAPAGSHTQPAPGRRGVSSVGAAGRSRGRSPCAGHSGGQCSVGAPVSLRIVLRGAVLVFLHPRH